MSMTFGWNSKLQMIWSSHACFSENLEPARVVKVTALSALIATSKDLVRVPNASLVVGDWAVTDGKVVHGVLPRLTALVRLSTGGSSKEQTIASNFDVAFIVEPLYPVPNLPRIERLLTLAWASGAKPILVLTKSDLGLGNQFEAILQIARAAEVVVVSAVSGENMDYLSSLIEENQTLVVFGSSGAGKSTLVNYFKGEEVLRIGQVRASGKGRHTTSGSDLVVVKNSSYIIDTPGIRSVGLTSADTGLQGAFDDVYHFATGCRFSDCRHIEEPDCAVKAAINEGAMAVSRLERYISLEREVRRQVLRKTTASRAADRVQTKGRNQAKAMVMRSKGRKFQE